MKQVIVVNKGLNMSKGKMAAQVSHASMAFLAHLIQRNSTVNKSFWHPAWEYVLIDFKTGAREKRPQRYRRSDLDTWAREARERGEDGFYARPKNPDSPYGPMELCEEDHYYSVKFDVDKDLYEQWLGGIFTKVILSAKNENQMVKIVEKAKENGFIEGADFFCIRDACLTELEPDETGSRWTCIGFRPMKAEEIDKVTGKLQLYRD